MELVTSVPKTELHQSCAEF